MQWITTVKTQQKATPQSLKSAPAYTYRLIMKGKHVNGISVMGASQWISAQLSKNVHSWANTKFNKARYRYKTVFQKWIIQ